MTGFVKFPDGFPAARIKLVWRDYPQVAEGFLPRPDMKPVRSKRGDAVFDGEDGEEAGGRDGSLQVIEHAADPVNVAKDMAARILSAEVEEEKEGTVRTRDNNSDRNEGDDPPRACRRPRPGGAWRAGTGDRACPRSRRSAGRAEP